MDFCTTHSLSGEALESIFNARSLLLGHLRASGFVRAKGPGDIKDLNVNSENWAVVKAALTAGLYPNVALKCDAITTAHKFGPVKIDEAVSVVDKETDNQWFIFDAKDEEAKAIRGVTIVSPITIFLFTGHNRLPTDYIQESLQGDV